MRRSDTIEGLIDKVCYLRAMIDAGSLEALKPFLEAKERLRRDRLKRKMEELNEIRKPNG